MNEKRFSIKIYRARRPSNSLDSNDDEHHAHFDVGNFLSIAVTITAEEPKDMP